MHERSSVSSLEILRWMVEREISKSFRDLAPPSQPGRAQGRVCYPINLTPRVGTRQGLLPEIYPTPDTIPGVIGYPTTYPSSPEFLPVYSLKNRVLKMGRAPLF
eukprot:scaffold26575_cov72-Cyclotella_meneghiniana.AAC.1